MVAVSPTLLFGNMPPASVAWSTPATSGWVNMPPGTSTPISGYASAGVNRLMVCFIWVCDNYIANISLVQYAGSSMTLQAYQNGVYSGGAQVYVWTLIAPTVGSGNFVVTATNGSSANQFMWVCCLSKVNQTTPVTAWAGSTGSSLYPALSGTSVPGDATLGAMVAGGASAKTFTSNGGQYPWVNTSVQVGAAFASAGLDSIDPTNLLSTSFGWTLSGSEGWGSCGLAVHPVF